MFRRSKKVIQVRINTRGIFLRFLDLSHHPLRFYIRERNTEKGKLEKQESVDSLCSCWSEKEDACRAILIGLNGTLPQREMSTPCSENICSLTDSIQAGQLIRLTPGDLWQRLKQAFHWHTPAHHWEGAGGMDLSVTLTGHWEEANGGRLNCDTCHWLV